MNLINKLLDNLEKCEDTCGLSMMVRALKGEKKFDGCKGLTCDECKEQANVMLDEWRKELNNNGWISVEERPAETDKKVLVCVELAKGITDVIVGIRFDNECDMEAWIDTTGATLEKIYEDFIGSHIESYDHPKVIAWQPLPAPYGKEK